MRKKIAPILTGILLLVGNATIAQEPDDATIRFNSADSDSDGTLSREEFKAYVTEKLPEFQQFDVLVERLDKDKDGLISKVEFGKRRPITQKLIDESENASQAPVEFVDKFNARYAKRKPLVGDSLGPLVGFDEYGNELDFESLKGKYTVFNFGCLT